MVHLRDTLITILFCLTQLVVFIKFIILGHMLFQTSPAEAEVSGVGTPGSLRAAAESYIQMVS